MAHHRLHRSLMKDRRGTTSVEFALVITAFIGLMITAAEFGRYLMLWHSLEYAADETGRYVTTAVAPHRPTATEIGAHLRQRLDGAGINSAAVTIAVTCSIGGTDTPIVGTDTCSPASDSVGYVTIAASASFDSLGIVDFALRATIQARSTVVVY